MINANRSHVCLRSTFCKATFYLATCIVLYMYCDKRPHYHTGGLVVQGLGHQTCDLMAMSLIPCRCTIGWLVLGWVTILMCNQPPRPTLSLLPSAGWEMSTAKIW